jgi:hypothetical protein
MPRSSRGSGRHTRKPMPPECFGDKQAFMESARNPTRRHLFDKTNISNLVFVYEEEAPSVPKASRDLFPLDVRRLNSECTVHVVFQNMEQGTSYVARDATHPHHQIMFWELVEALDKFDDSNFPSVDIYPPDQCKQTSFVCSWNRDPGFDAILDQIAWATFPHTIALAEQRGLGQARQHHYADFGLSSDIAGSRRDNPWSSPFGFSTCERRSQGFIDNVTLENYFKFGSVAVEYCWSHTNFPGWVNQLFQDDGSGRQPRFCQQLFPNSSFVNHVDSTRPAATTIESACTIHRDTFNSTIEYLAPTLSLSRVINSVRYTLICYSRKSVDSTMEKERLYGPIFQSMKNLCLAFRNDHRLTCPSQKKPTSLTLLPGGPTLEVSGCCMDPTNYVAPYAVAAHDCIISNRLSYPECFAVIQVFEMCPFTAYYFCMACALLSRNCVKQFPEQPQRYMVSYELCRTMQGLRGLHPGSKVKLPNRFAACGQRKDKMPTLSEWQTHSEKRYRKLVDWSMRNWECPSEKKKAISYKELTTIVTDDTDGTGQLTARHSIVLHSLLGLLPNWVVPFCLVTHNNENLRFLLQRFGIDRKHVDTTDKAMTFTKSLCTYLSTELGIPFPYSFGENLFCKAKRYFDALDYQYMLMNARLSGSGRKRKKDFPVTVEPSVVNLESIFLERYDKKFKDSSFQHLSDIRLSLRGDNWSLSVKRQDVGSWVSLAPGRGLLLGLYCGLLGTSDTRRLTPGQILHCLKRNKERLGRTGYEIVIDSLHFNPSIGEPKPPVLISVVGKSTRQVSSFYGHLLGASDTTGLESAMARMVLGGRNDSREKRKRSKDLCPETTGVNVRKNKKKN